MKRVDAYSPQSQRKRRRFAPSACLEPNPHYVPGIRHEWMITRCYMSAGALQKAQLTAERGSDPERKELQEEPMLVGQLAA